MHHPIITVYIQGGHRTTVHFLRRLRDDGFNPFISAGQAKLYDEQILLIDCHGCVSSAGLKDIYTAPQDIVATVKWIPELTRDELLFARCFYENYFFGQDTLFPTEFDYMNGLGYFSPPPMAQPIDFERMIQQMTETVQEKRKCMDS